MSSEIKKTYNDRLNAKLMAESKRINAPITVSEIVLVPTNPLGEYSRDCKDIPVYRANRSKRIAALVSRLKDIAWETYNNFRKKLHHANHLIRVHLPEFALYPAEAAGPLTASEFSQLIADIEELVKDLSPNIHFNLGTLPLEVYESDGRAIVMNVNLYVICGNEAIINVSRKATRAAEDLSYAIPTYEFYKAGIDRGKPKQALKITAPLLDAKEQSFSFAPGIFACTTEGGARVIIVLDICLDNKKDIATATFEEIRLTASVDTALQTANILHTLISNTIDVNSIVGTQLFHVDPQKHGLVEKDQTKFVTSRDIRVYDLLMQDDTVFGSNYEIFKYAPYEIIQSKEETFLVNLMRQNLINIQPLYQSLRYNSNLNTEEKAKISSQMIKNLHNLFYNAIKVICLGEVKKHLCKPYMIMLRSGWEMLEDEDRVQKMFNVAALLQERFDNIYMPLLYATGRFLARMLQEYFPTLYAKRLEERKKTLKAKSLMPGALGAISSDRPSSVFASSAHARTSSVQGLFDSLSSTPAASCSLSSSLNSTNISSPIASPTINPSRIEVNALEEALSRLSSSANAKSKPRVAT